MKKGGVGALRHKLGRSSNQDLVVVSPLNMWFEDNAHTPGCVNFKVEISTCKINGATGSLTPPHLGERSRNLLKSAYYKDRIITYAREKCPRSHPLIAAGWHNLPPDVHVQLLSRSSPIVVCPPPTHTPEREFSGAGDICVHVYIIKKRKKQ